MDVAAAVDALRRGRVVGLPTDTVYGIAADPHSEGAVCTLYELKGRPGRKPIPLLVASVAQAGTVAELSPEAESYALERWPGALTLVLPRRTVMPEWVGDPARGTVAVRVPDDAAALELLSATGPLAVTSANPTGQPPATDAAAAEERFGDAVALYLPGECPGRESSTVVDFTVYPAELLRPGPVAFP